MIQRTITGAALIILLIFAIAMGSWVFAVLCMAALCIALYEMERALTEAGHRPVQWPVWACMILSIPCFLLYSNVVLIPLVSVTCMITAAYVMFRKDPKLEDVLMSVMPIFGIVLPGMCLMGFLKASRGMQIILWALAFGVPTVGDTFAYFVGSRMGKTKLIPAVSPNKTVAGAVAGIVGSIVWAMLTFAIGSAFVEGLPPFWHFALIGLGGGLAGQIGDLFASLIKRHCGVKDYGTIFPGHGGMMDRLDSILFATVLIYAYASIAGIV